MEDILGKICVLCGLGEMTSEPEKLTGGYLHKMYSLTTDRGEYAIKLLAPYIMQRPDAMENYRRADELETVLENSGIPIVPAITFGGKKMQRIDGRYFYVYEFFEGEALKDGEIRVSHCEKIASVLAKIHSLGQKKTGFSPEPLDIDWDRYIKEYHKRDDELYNLLEDSRDILFESMKKGNEAVKKLPPKVSVCHNDMDSKNVLWKGDSFRIIDLECLGYSSPVMEAYELALCWSGYESCDIDTDKFEAFLRAYLKAGGELDVDSEILCYSSYGRLEWLEYNIKRSLGIECDAEDKEAAQAQVKETVAHAVYYHKMKDMLIQSLQRVINGG